MCLNRSRDLRYLCPPDIRGDADRQADSIIKRPVYCTIMSLFMIGPVYSTITSLLVIGHKHISITITTISRIHIANSDP